MDRGMDLYSNLLSFTCPFNLRLPPAVLKRSEPNSRGKSVGPEPSKEWDEGRNANSVSQRSQSQFFLRRTICGVGRCTNFEHHQMIRGSNLAAVRGHQNR